MALGALCLFWLNNCLQWKQLLSMPQEGATDKPDKLTWSFSYRFYGKKPDFGPLPALLFLFKICKKEQRLEVSASPTNSKRNLTTIICGQISKLLKNVLQFFYLYFIIKKIFFQEDSVDKSLFFKVCFYQLNYSKIFFMSFLII